jgi:hypothetical protein
MTGVVYLDMFKEFLKTVLKNRVLMNCCCSKAYCRKPLHFHIAVQAVLSRSLHKNVLVEVVISPGHFIPLIIHHLISSSGVHEGCFYALSLSTSSLGLADRIQSVVAAVIPTILTDVWTELVYR